MEKITRTEAIEIAVERYVDAWKIDDLLAFAHQRITEDILEYTPTEQDELFEDMMISDDYDIE